MKKITAFLIVVMMVLLAACGGNSATQSNSGSNGQQAENSNQNTSDGEKVEFRVAWWGSVDRHDKYNKILDMYEEQNPHVSLIREFATFNDYWDKLATQAAGGNLPDLITLHTQIYGMEYTQKGLLIPLNDYIDNGIIDTTGWDPGVLGAGEVDGKMYSISKGVTGLGMIVNLDMIRRVGMEFPEGKITWDEFLTFAEELQSKLPEGSYVIEDGGRLESLFDTYIRNKGKNLFSNDGKALGFDKEDLLEYWNMFVDLRNAGIVPPPEITNEYANAPWEDSAFVKNIVAIVTQNTNQAKTFDQYTEDEVAIIRLPVLEGQPFGSGENWISSGWAITKNSDESKREEIAKFINWFVNDPEAQKIYNAEIGITGPAHIAEILKETMHPMDVQAFEHVNEVSSDMPVSMPRAEGAPAIVDLYQQTYDEINYGIRTVEEAVDHFFAESEKILNR